MEKRRPHFSLLTVVRCSADPDAVQFTRVAYDGAAELQMSRNDMLPVIRNLTIGDFYKSMTTYGDHQAWQDVYRPTYRGIPLYLKLTMIESANLLVVSFKRR